MLTDEQISNLQERLSMAHLNDEAKIYVDVNILQILVNVHRNRAVRDVALDTDADPSIMQRLEEAERIRSIRDNRDVHEIHVERDGDFFSIKLTDTKENE